MVDYVLCRPKGGLNDILCQIETCWQYAVAHDRKLVVDTQQSGLLDDFSNYFEVKGEYADIAELDISALENLAADASCFPEFANVDAAAYRAVFDAPARNYIETESGQKITFDFEQSYPHELLVHHQCGGGAHSIDLMKRLQFTKETAEHVKAALAKLPESYISIHVRNTDLATDYKTFFASLKKAVDGKDILVCSDDRACVDYGREYFDNSRVFSVSDIPETGGKPLHMNASLDRYSANIDMLVDLFCLANGQALHLTRVDRGFLSGFSRLAQSLNRNRDVLDSLLS